VAFDAGLGEFGIALKPKFANRLIILEISPAKPAMLGLVRSDQLRWRGDGV
jgi:hypothetical protein